MVSLEIKVYKASKDYRVIKVSKDYKEMLEHKDSRDKVLLVHKEHRVIQVALKVIKAIKEL
jgi:hypothetical protein